MEIIRHEKFTELKADEGKVIVSKSKTYDEETGEYIYDIKGYDIFLGIYDDIDNYEEIDDTNEE